MARQISAVLARFPAGGGVRGIQPVGGGFSGGSVWRVDTAAGPLCLRRWPEEYSRERLAWVLAAAAHAQAAGCGLLPISLLAAGGGRIVVAEGRLWELSTWLPGRADFAADPSRLRLAAAMHALAEIHRALAGFDDREFRGPIPAMHDRLRRIEWLRDKDLARIRNQPIPAAWPELTELRQQWAAYFQEHCAAIFAAVYSARHLPVRIQAVLRDIWHDHVLFTGERVTGIVDLGAMRVDTIATDLARLLGSLLPGDQSGWDFALAAYRERAALSADEEQLVRTLDAANVLLTPATWLEWLLVERREFASPQAVRQRLTKAFSRLT